MGGKSSSSSTQSETINNDNRVVNDAGGGKLIGAGAANAEAGAYLTNVGGTGNTITDGRAFDIVDKLVTGLGQVANAQTNVARDIALMGTTQGTEYAKAAAAAQVAALNQTTQTAAASDRAAIALASLGSQQSAAQQTLTNAMSGFSSKTMIALAVGAVVLLYVVKK